MCPVCSREEDLRWRAASEPHTAVDDVAAGEVYVVTRHNREVARVIPTVSSAILPPRSAVPSRTVGLTRIDLPDDISFDDFTRDLSGEW